MEVTAPMSREFSVTYYPYPQIDPKTGKVSDLFRPTIPIKRGIPRPIFGIGKVKIPAYTHKVLILGRFGFFDQFKRVLFREKKKEVCFKI